MFKHSVQDDKEFTHASGKSHFLSFAGGKETLVETANDGVVLCGDQRRHIQDFPHSGSATPDSAPTPQGATIPVERRHPDQSCYLPTVQSSQFGKLGQECSRKNRPHAGNTPQQILLLSPQRTTLDPTCQLTFNIDQLIRALPEAKVIGEVIKQGEEERVVIK